MKPLPPLLALAEGRRVRPRKAKPDSPREIALHKAVAGLLRQHAKDDWRWGHYPAGEHRDIRTAAKLKAMGTMAGWPDLLLFSPAGLLHGLELKREGEDLTAAQAEFQLWAIRRGIPYSVARSIGEALKILDSWGCLRIRVAST